LFDNTFSMWQRFLCYNLCLTVNFVDIACYFLLFIKVFIKAIYQKGKRYWIPLQARCVAQRVGRGIALLFHDRGTRRG